jgi:hypothetical protein
MRVHSLKRERRVGRMDDTAGSSRRRINDSIPVVLDE